MLARMVPNVYMAIESSLYLCGTLIPARMCARADQRNFASVKPRVEIKRLVLLNLLSSNGYCTGIRFRSRHRHRLYRYSTRPPPPPRSSWKAVECCYIICHVAYGVVAVGAFIPMYCRGCGCSSTDKKWVGAVGDRRLAIGVGLRDTQGGKTLASTRSVGRKAFDARSGVLLFPS